MAEELLSFGCPRCGSDVSERFWGPCATCRAELVEKNDAAPATGDGADDVRFEPKMNVTPNHVATKE